MIVPYSRVIYTELSIVIVPYSRVIYTAHLHGSRSAATVMAYPYTGVRALCVSERHLEVSFPLNFLFNGDAAAVVQAH